MYRGGGSKKKLSFLNMKKKSSSRPFLAHPAGGQETTFNLRVAPAQSGTIPVYSSLTVSVLFWFQSQSASPPQSPNNTDGPSSASAKKKKPDDFIFGKVIGEGSYSTVSVYEFS